MPRSASWSVTVCSNSINRLRSPVGRELRSRQSRCRICSTCALGSNGSRTTSTTQVSHCLEMLFGGGQDDMAAYAAALPMVSQPPGSMWNYSSGTTNIICRIIGDIVGGGRDGMEAFLRERLVRARSACTVRFRSSTPPAPSSDRRTCTPRHATSPGSVSSTEMTASSMAAESSQRVGAITPARTSRATRTASTTGGHWWLWRDQPGSLACHGYEGQYCIVLPDKEMVVVHLGQDPADVQVELTSRLRRSHRQRRT